jgi:hypothetical protein
MPSKYCPTTASDETFSLTLLNCHLNRRLIVILYPIQFQKRVKKNDKLGLADAEYLGTAGGAYTLNRRAFVFESCLFCVFDLYFLSTLHAVSLGHFPNLLYLTL